MLRKASSGPSHWSKDFVEHLRSVHFALIGASTAVILAAVSVKPYNSVTAVRQVSEIIELKKSWSPTFVLDRLTDPSEDPPYGSYADPYIDPLSHTGDYDLKGFGILGSVEWIGEHRKSPMSVVFVFPDLMFMMGRNWPIVRNWNPRADPGETLADFRRWWDGLLRSPTVLIPRGFSRKATLKRSPIPATSPTLESLRQPREKSARSYLPSSGYALLGALDTASNFEPSLLRVHLLLMGSGPSDVVWTTKPLELTYEGNFIDKDSSVNATIPIVTQWEVQLTQQKLAKCFPNWQLGRFDRSFWDLAQAAKGLEALELEDLRRIVSEDAARGSEVLEVFGFKFPVGRVTVWSTVVLWCIQLYFLVYLKQLSGKLDRTDPGWDVPWIGMDQSGLARFLLFITITFLPCVSLAFWGVRTFRQVNWFAVVNGLGFIVTLIFGVWCWKYRPQPKARISGESAEG